MTLGLPAGAGVLLSQRPTRGPQYPHHSEEMTRGAGKIRDRLAGQSSTNKNAAILFLAPLVLFLAAFAGAKAQNLHVLPAPQALQENLPPVAEPHCVPVLVGFSAQLHTFCCQPVGNTGQ